MLQTIMQVPGCRHFPRQTSSTGKKTYRHQCCATPFRPRNRYPKPKFQTPANPLSTLLHRKEENFLHLHNAFPTLPKKPSKDFSSFLRRFLGLSCHSGNVCSLISNLFFRFVIHLQVCVSSSLSSAASSNGRPRQSAATDGGVPGRLRP